MDPHEVLGVARDATEAEILAAYRVLVRRHHPDRHVGEPPEVQRAEADRMAEVTGAYHLLNDPAAFARYEANQARVGRAPGHEPEHGSRGAADDGAFDYRRAAASEFMDDPGDGRWGRTPPPPTSRRDATRGGRWGRTPSGRTPATGRPGPSGGGGRLLNALAWVLLAGLALAIWVLATDTGQRAWDSVRSTVTSAPAPDSLPADVARGTT